MNYIYSEANIPWKEKEKIRHEVNTSYRKYKGLRFIVHRSVGIDNQYYVYYIEIHGFDDMRILSRIQNND